jgi:hypothetical protein
METKPESDAEMARLRGENDLLRDEFVRLFVEQQELLHIVRPNLLRLHSITVGAWELRRLEAGVKAKRLRRKIVMIETRLHAGEAVRLDEIDRQLALEFAEWEQRGRTLAAEVGASRQSLANLMNDADEAEFKNLHCELVKKFHPALAGELAPDAQAVWDRLQDAYARHDLAGLRALRLVSKSVVPPEKSFASAALLNAEQERLGRLIGKILLELADMRHQPPFTLEKLLNDSAWVEQRRDEIGAETALLSAEAAGLEIRLAKLLPAIGNVMRFGAN